MCNFERFSGRRKAVRGIAATAALLAAASFAPAAMQPASAAAMEEAAASQRAAVRRMRDSITQQRTSVERMRSAVQRQGPPPALDLVWPSAPVCEPLSQEEAARLARQAAQREGLAESLLLAVAGQESDLLPCAVSPKGAQGLMQLMPLTALEFGVRNPFDPEENMAAGAKFLKQLLLRYGGDLALALGAYNAGPSRVDAAGAVPPIAETVDYVNRVLERASE